MECAFWIKQTGAHGKSNELTNKQPIIFFLFLKVLEFSSGSFQPNLTPHEDNCPSTFSIPSYYSLSIPSLLPVLKGWLNLVFYVSKYVCSSLPHMWVGWFLAGLSLEDFLVCTKEVNGSMLYIPFRFYETFAICGKRFVCVCELC